ncbi:MAG: histidine kinase dimerization/phospho-acceptor domain-containing protein, partial [Dialister sp.]|nr:histidine kinase dimerization/phospho-acceptor domain-containing protein [Dialister sp.]
MDMIKKLHRQFILLATLAVFIIIAVALSVINGMMYLIVRGDIHDVLETIADNGGVITTRRISGGGWLPDGSWVEDTPEFTYQTRYFSVLLDSDGTAKVTNINHIAAFSAESAVEAAVAAVKTGESEGYFQKQKGTYAYHVSRTTDGDLLVVILDCTRDLSAVKAFLKYSSLFGLLCLLLFVGIVTVLSGIAIRPFVRNMENQKRFITNASHELKTPIAIISANAEAMELINGKNEWTGNIISQVKRLSLLINDLVLLSKIGETSAKDLTLVDTDLSEAVKSSAGSFRQMIEDAG